MSREGQNSYLPKAIPLETITQESGLTRNSFTVTLVFSREIRTGHEMPWNLPIQGGHILVNVETTPYSGSGKVVNQQGHEG